MKCKVMDTLTGQTAESSGRSTFEWVENNWSCDCNRASLFGINGLTDTCHCERFIVIEAEPESAEDYPATIAELNACYPESLIAQHKK